MAINDETTSVNAAMKVYYRGGKLTRIGYDEHPFLAMVPKRRDFKGLNVPLIPWFAGTAGRSHSLVRAQANVSSERTATFALTVVRDYAVTTLDRMNMLATADDEGSFLKLATDAVDNTARIFQQNHARGLYRNQGGARGRIAVGGVSGNVLTLSNAGDIVNFELSMRLRQSTADGTSGALGSGDSTITAVDRQLGKITLASATNFVANDYLFQDGDHSSQSGFSSYAGLQAWLPAGTPSATSFFGVDRTVDSRLYGQYLNASTAGLSHAEALSRIDTALSREGGRPDIALLNPLDFDTLRINLGSQVVYDKVASAEKATISFSAISFMGSKGPIKIVADPDCVQGEMFVLQLKTWELWSLGETPRGAEANGLKFITQTAADGAEVRLAGYSNLGCVAPSYNGRVTLAV